MLQGDLVEQGPSLAQVDEHIEIAVRPPVTLGDGPEDPDRPRAMTRGDSLDLIAATTQLVQFRCRPG